MLGSQKVLHGIRNPQVFNPATCQSFVSEVTEYLYNLPAHHFYPKGAEQVEHLKKHGPEIMDTLFQVRVALHEKLQEFDSRNELSKECLTNIRAGFNYARFAEEYLLDWLYSKNIYSFTKTPIMSNSKPSTWTNSKYEGFELKSGDVLLIRGKSYVSAMIARIADDEGHFSHLAIVGEDKSGNKYIVEALIQYGVTVTPLEKWRQAEDSRVALFRHSDEALAKKAALYIYDHAQAALDRKKGIRYDFSMNDDDYSSLFCSEVIRMAYDKASEGRLMIPKYRSTVLKFKNSEYPRSLGVTKKSLFAPYDIEADPRFDFVAEYRHLPLLRQVRMQDAVLQSMYSWMIEKNYTFHWAPQHAGKAFLAKLVRQFGVAKETLPKYMPLESIKTNVQFEAVAKELEQNIYKKEEEFYQKNGFPPSFQDMLEINEKYRMEDCQKSRFSPDSVAPMHPKADSSKFHGFFYSSDNKCH